MGRLVGQWLLELLFSIGRFFLHPLLYFFLIFSFLNGYWRVRRERKSFHVRVYDVFDDIRFTYTKGIIAGLILSVLFMLLGLWIPFGTLVLLTIWLLAVSLTFQPRFLSSSISLGGTIFLTALLNGVADQSPWIDEFFVSLDKTNYSVLSLFLSFLLICEGILIYRTAHYHTSPFIIKSKRGMPIGNHVANRTWMIPLMLLVPGGSLESPFSWWPIISLNGEPFMLVMIPYFVGFYQRIQGSLPKESIQVTGRRISILGIISLVVAAASLWAPFLSFVAAALALIGKGLITVKQRMNDNSAAFYFSKQDYGLVVLGTLPQSPGEKMGIKAGEVITKVNGKNVKTTYEFYEALQISRTHCKLEVLGHNKEIRFVQRALYEGEHHELGLLFVQGEKWKSEAS